MRTTSTGVPIDDARAPVVIGLELVEIEPNEGFVDVGTFELDVTNATPQDLGMLSGPGFVDFLTGEIFIFDDATGFVHDSDTFTFTVPASELLYFELGWDGDADIDVIFFDSEGVALDWAASLENPEVSGGYWEFVPDETYYLSVLGYAGTADVANPWELKMEHIAY